MGVFPAWITIPQPESPIDTVSYVETPPDISVIIFEEEVIPPNTQPITGVTYGRDITI